MSYILEALRRAERERDTGKAPTVESLNRSVVEIDRTRAPLSVWILAIATAVIACAALAILLWPHPHPAPQASEKDAAVQPMASSAAAPAQASLYDPPPSTATATATATTIEDRDDVISLDDVTGDAPPSSDEVSAAPSPAALEPEDTATASSVETAPVPVAATNPQPPASTLDTDRGTIMVPSGVTVLREMPASYREQFPVRTLDVHVYDPDPAKRWVMIDGTRYREGNTIASGPQIEQIIEAGVVFDYQGARVLLPVR